MFGLFDDPLGECNVIENIFQNTNIFHWKIMFGLFDDPLGECNERTHTESV